MVKARQILLPACEGRSEVKYGAAIDRADPVDRDSVVGLSASLVVGANSGNRILDTERFVAVSALTAI